MNSETAADDSDTSIESESTIQKNEITTRNRKTDHTPRDDTYDASWKLDYSSERKIVVAAAKKGVDVRNADTHMVCTWNPSTYPKNSAKNVFVEDVGELRITGVQNVDDGFTRDINDVHEHNPEIVREWFFDALLSAGESYIEDISKNSVKIYNPNYYGEYVVEFTFE